MENINRTYLLNYIIKQREYEDYLEIGTAKLSRNFDHILCKNKDSVDCNKRFKSKYIMTSDEFFRKIDKHKRYDIIFIDGSHLEQQVMKDIISSLNYLSNNGMIILHDCSPVKEKHQLEKYPGKGKIWNGTVWKAFAKLRMTRKDLYMCVVDIDYGIGVICRGEQNCFSKIDDKYLTYEFLNNNRKELLNLCSIEDFKIKMRSIM